MLNFYKNKSVSRSDWLFFNKRTDRYKLCAPMWSSNCQFFSQWNLLNFIINQWESKKIPWFHEIDSFSCIFTPQFPLHQGPARLIILCGYQQPYPRATPGYLRGFVVKTCPRDRGIRALPRLRQTSPGELPTGFAEPGVSSFSGNTSHGRELSELPRWCFSYIVQICKYNYKKGILLHFLSRWSEISNLKSHHHLKLYCVGE